MRDVVFSSQAKSDFEYWKKTNRKIFQKIKQLIQDIDRSPFQGIGKPEPLKHELAGYWSRRINSQHRLVYQTTNKNEIIIASCKGHYD